MMPIWYIAALWTGLGCHPSPTPIHEVTTILDTVAKDPTQSKTLCTQIHPVSERSECILIGVDALKKQDLSLASSLCDMLSGSDKDECWFRLAEVQDNASLCKNAGQFQLDCTMHVLSRWLFRNPEASWSEMTSRARQYGVSPTSVEGETVLYRHVISSTKPMDLSKCEGLPNLDACTRAAKSVYRDRLRFAENQGTFPCTMDTHHPLSPVNQPLLQVIHDEFHDANCPD